MWKEGKKKKTKQKLTSTNSLLMERHTPAFISQSKFLWKQNSDTHTHTKKMVSQVLIKKALQTSTKWSATSLLFWHRDCNHKTTGTTSGMIFTLETVYLSLPCTNKMNLDLWLGKKMFIASILQYQVLKRTVNCNFRFPLGDVRPDPPKFSPVIQFLREAAKFIF